MANIPADPARYETAALEAITWIRGSALKAEHGLVWPMRPATQPRVDYGVYHGISGVILALLDAYRTTGDDCILDDALLGADALTHHVTCEATPGLYSGMAGQSVVLLSVFAASRRECYLECARSAAQLLMHRASPVGHGVEWNAYTDVMAGTAGIGLALLHITDLCGLPEGTAVALRAGERLLDVAVPTEGDGLRWNGELGAEWYMPNFSHGTAGVSYFLAQLYASTGDARFLCAAEAGARHLLRLGTPADGGGIRIYSSDRNRNLFYLGWCNGPAGTARLFYRLWEITGQREWASAIERLTRPILSSGVPESRPAGYWNSIGRCCGAASVAEYLLDLFELGGPPEYLDLATRLTNNLLERGASPWWVQSPLHAGDQSPQPVTGWMHGAAGLATWLLRFSRFVRGAPEHPVRLPDCPWPKEPNDVRARESGSNLFEHTRVE